VAPDFHDTMDRLRRSREQREGAAYRQAVADLRTLAQRGDMSAAEVLAEELALYGSTRDDLEEAYKWYYVSLSQQGYSVGWEDHNHTPPHYCGPVGDFRNEPMVSDLVTILGWDRARQLDQEAARWLAEQRGS
jgi:hypothetical protein